MVKELNKILLLAFNFNDAITFIKENKLKQSNVSIIINKEQLNGLNRGHKAIQTNLAYINPQYNDMISELVLAGTKLEV